MTETSVQTPVPGPESHADGLSTPPEGDGAEEPESGPEGSESKSKNPNREAAAYRVKLREAETQREALAQRVERMQRAEVERLAADKLSHPADLFSLSGNELADYLTEDGDVDADRVAADLGAILAERPGLQKPRHPAGYDPSQGHGGNPGKKGPSSWADLLKT